MSLVFIPTTDYSSNANSAETISAVEVGYLQAGSSTTVSFSIGNRGESEIVISITSDHPQVSLSVDALTLAPDAVSDTITATIAAPFDCQTTLETSYVTAGESALTLTWFAVGANTDRLPQFPDRAGDFTDSITTVLDKFAEPLRLYRFDPLPYDPEDSRIFAIPGGRFRSQRDVSCRLDPHDEIWGYRQSVQTVVGCFQSEDWSVTSSFTRDNSTITYSGSAVLLLPAEFELVREWALFNPARGADRAQWKRSVMLMQRQGQVWCLWSIIPKYRGQDLAYWRCHLLPLSSPTMGSPGSYNPFATTWDGDGSDRPYAHFSCQTSISFSEIAQQS